MIAIIDKLYLRRRDPDLRSLEPIQFTPPLEAEVRIKYSTKQIDLFGPKTKQEMKKKRANCDFMITRTLIPTLL